MQSPMATTASTDAIGWNSHAQYYDSTIGKWLTFPLSKDIVSWVDSLFPFDTLGSTAFDNGCGTGAITRQLIDLYPSLPILATDISPKMVRHFEKLVMSATVQHVQVKLADAMDLDLPDNLFTHSLSVAMIGSTPSPLRVAEEMYRVTKPGGIIGITSYVGHHFPSLWQEAVRRALDQPNYVAPKMMDPSVDSQEGMRVLLDGAGWQVVDVRTKHLIFGWKSRDEAMEFLFEHGNPIVGVVTKGMEHQIHQIRPMFEKVFDEIHPIASSYFETGILAVAWKK